MKNCGFTEDTAKQIEAKYHDLYAVADTWIQDLIQKAEKCGYIPLAFGGRIRTPLIAQSAGKGRMRPYKAQEEERSAGNAATQSYCVLTLRAMNEFMERVWASPYKYDILPTATIHDSIYPMVKDDVHAVKWVNDNLIDCMAWQELPELKHPTIKISSGLEIYWPNWARAIAIPNHASEQEIKAICDEAKKETI
jgi:DNA polymerase-1